MGHLQRAKPPEKYPPTQFNPGSLTDEVQAEVIDLLKEGHPVLTVCHYVGISDTTYYSWLKKGTAYEKEMMEDGEPNPYHERYAVFRKASLRAMAEWKMERLRRLNSKDTGPQWVKELELLARRDRVHFGKDTHEGVGEDFDADETFL